MRLDYKNMITVNGNDSIDVYEMATERTIYSMSIVGMSYDELDNAIGQVREVYGNHWITD
jgi:hypothetical protein